MLGAAGPRCSRPPRGWPRAVTAAGAEPGPPRSVRLRLCSSGSSGAHEARDLCLRNRCPLRLGSSGTPVLGIPTAPQPFAASLGPGCWPSDSPGASHSGQHATPSETGRVFSRALVFLAPPPTLVSSLLFCPSRPHRRVSFAEWLLPRATVLSSSCKLQLPEEI